MNREEIKAILPHREPMLLVDEVSIENTEHGQEAVGRYAVKGNEWFLQGHFPGNPVVPGVVLCEMMAQACCVLLGKHVSEDATPFFTTLNKVKFRRPVKPGETMESHCRITREKHPFYFAEGVGQVEGRVAVSAEFSFAMVQNRE